LKGIVGKNVEVEGQRAEDSKLGGIAEVVDLHDDDRVSAASTTVTTTATATATAIATETNATTVSVTTTSNVRKGSMDVNNESPSLIIGDGVADVAVSGGAAGWSRDEGGDGGGDSGDGVGVYFCWACGSPRPGVTLSDEHIVDSVVGAEGGGGQGSDTGRGSGRRGGDDDGTWQVVS
jgi:hypothetical protein